MKTNNVCPVKRSCHWVNGNNPRWHKAKNLSLTAECMEIHFRKQTTAPGPGCSASTLYLNFALCANFMSAYPYAALEFEILTGGLCASFELFCIQ